MGTIGQMQRAALANLTGEQRLLRAVALYEEFRTLIACQINNGEQTCDAKHLRWQIACRLYGHSKAVMNLLNRVKP